MNATTTLHGVIARDNVIRRIGWENKSKRESSQSALQ
jgi:hypothetical protein